MSLTYTCKSENTPGDHTGSDINWKSIAPEEKTQPDNKK